MTHDCHTDDGQRRSELAAEPHWRLVSRAECDMSLAPGVGGLAGAPVPPAATPRSALIWAGGGTRPFRQVHSEYRKQKQILDMAT